jgi:hypothetical protein
MDKSNRGIDGIALEWFQTGLTQKVKMLKVMILYSVAYRRNREPPDQHRFTMWQTTARNDEDVRRQAVTFDKLVSPDPPSGCQASHPSSL